MVKPKYQYPPIDNLAQLWSTSRIVLTYNGREETFKRTFNQPIERFESFYFGVGYKGFYSKALEMIKNEPEKYVSVERNNKVQDTIKWFMQDQYGHHPFYVSKESFEVIFASYLVAPGSYFESKLLLTSKCNSFILKFDTASGIKINSKLTSLLTLNLDG